MGSLVSEVAGERLQRQFFPPGENIAFKGNLSRGLISMPGDRGIALEVGHGPCQLRAPTHSASPARLHAELLLTSSMNTWRTMEMTAQLYMEGTLVLGGDLGYGGRRRRQWHVAGYPLLTLGACAAQTAPTTTHPASWTTGRMCRCRPGTWAAHTLPRRPARRRCMRDRMQQQMAAPARPAASAPVRLCGDCLLLRRCRRTSVPTYIVGVPGHDHAEIGHT